MGVCFTCHCTSTSWAHTRRGTNTTQKPSHEDCPLQPTRARLSKNSILGICTRSTGNKAIAPWPHLIGSANPTQVVDLPLLHPYHQYVGMANKHKMQHIYMLIWCRFDPTTSIKSVTGIKGPTKDERMHILEINRLGPTINRLRGSTISIGCNISGSMGRPTLQGVTRPHLSGPPCHAQF